MSVSQEESKAQAPPGAAPEYSVIPPTFKPPRWRDVPCIFILLSFLIGFIVVATLDLIDYSKTRCYKSSFGDSRVVFFDPQILSLISICILFTFIFAGLYYCIAAMYTSHFVMISMALQIAVSLGCSIFYLSQARWLSGAFSILWLISSAIIYWIVRTFIHTATIQIDITMRVAERNASLIFISVLGALFSAAWSVLIGSVALAGFGKTISEECSAKHRLRPEGEFLALLAYVAISNYLMTEMVKGCVRVAICYTFGWWCFMPKAQPPSAFVTDTRDEFPSIPSVTWMGLLASLTYSLGSICLSSLWLAVVKLLSQILAIWSQALMVNPTVDVGPDISLILLAWLLSNFVSYLDSALTHFNNYILVYIAVDNVSYFEGFIRSLDLIASEGFNAVLNDCLAGGTLTFGSWCIASIVALIAYIYMRWIQPYPVDGIYFICSYVLLISMQICSILTTGISSGVQTIFVAMAAEPARLRQVHPQVYEALTSQ
nr:Pns1 [Starmerella bombicola]